MSRFFIFIFIYILISFPVQAQKLISTNGGVINNSNSGSVSYSVGEPIISTISGGSNGDVTQGYQQISSTTCGTSPNENSNVEIPYNQGEYQPKIYAGETGKCKTIRIDSDNGAKLRIEATGKLKVEN